jgi:hypothetical protein
LFKFEFDCYEVFLARQKRTSMQLWLIVTWQIGKSSL